MFIILIGEGYQTNKRYIMLYIRGQPFDSWGGGGYGFFVKKSLFSKFCSATCGKKIVCSRNDRKKMFDQ